MSLKQWQQLCLSAALQANGNAEVFRAALDEALQVIPFDFQRLFCQVHTSFTPQHTTRTDFYLYAKFTCGQHSYSALLSF